MRAGICAYYSNLFNRSVYSGPCKGYSVLDKIAKYFAMRASAYMKLKLDVGCFVCVRI